MTYDKTSQTCQTCTFLLESESSKTGFRCGYDYFKKKPRDRIAVKMDQYKSVNLSDVCSRWQKHSPSVMSDKFL